MEAAFEAISTVRAYGASLVDRAEYLMHHVGTHHNLPRGVPQSLVERVRKASRKLETLLKRLETAAPDDDEAVDLDAPLDGHRSPLAIACAAGIVELAALLLLAGADPNIIELNGTTPLMLACEKGSAACAALLLLAGADPTATRVDDEYTASEMARLANQLECVALLRDQADGKLEPHFEVNHDFIGMALRRARRLLPWSSTSTSSKSTRTPLGATIDEALFQRALRLCEAVGVPISTIRTLEGEANYARTARARALDGSACPFYFLRRESLLSYLDSLVEHEQHLDVPQQTKEIRAEHPDWFVIRTISLVGLCRGNYVDDCLAISAHPTPTAHLTPAAAVASRAKQARKIAAYLRTHPRCRYVWYGPSCLDWPTILQKKTPPALHHDAQPRHDWYEMALMLHRVGDVFSSCSVVLLYTHGYLSQPWRRFEAWLAMQDAAAHGLVCSTAETTRCTVIRPDHHRASSGTPSHSMDDAESRALSSLIEALEALPAVDDDDDDDALPVLLEEWGRCSPAEAHAQLSDALLVQPYKAYADLAVPQIMSIDYRVRHLRFDLADIWAEVCAAIARRVTCAPCR